MLTDEQIDVIVGGIRSWANPEILRGEVPRPTLRGRPAIRHGAEVYATYCSACHGPDGREEQGSSIVDGSYLALVSDQNLRTVVITGRPELGAPDWRNNVPGSPCPRGDFRCCRLAGGSAAAISRPALSRTRPGLRDESNSMTPINLTRTNRQDARCS